MELTELGMAIAELEEKRTIDLITDRIKSGEDPIAILYEARNGMEMVGKKFEKGEYFLSELIAAAKFFKEGMKILEPHLPTYGGATIGKVLIGTPKGDIHDIGKNIVSTMIKSNGFDVYDLGVDVPVDVFVKKVAEIRPQIVAMSALLTVTFDSMKKIIDDLEQTRNNIGFKILIGGAPVDERVRDYVRADYYGKDAVEAVAYSKKIVEELRRCS